MALDYYKVNPDRVALLGKHFTPGSMNRNIQYITRHHTAGVLDADALNRVWDSRPASTHYLADPKGIISQHVWDKDVAWSNGNAASNAVTLTIEHANSAGGGSDWPISDATITAGARWAAALCLYYKLGSPKFGTNIRDHRNFTQTSCPYHLAHGGKYHQKWMDEAISFYHKLKNKEVHPDGTPIATTIAPPKKEHTAVNNEHDLHHLAKSIENQLLGPTQDERAENDRNPNGGRGWPQLGHNQDGQWLTVVDSIAALRQDVANLTDLIKENRNG